MSTNIWWAYDDSSGTFSPLPASPLLLPAIGLFFLLAVYDRMRHKWQSGKILATANQLGVDNTTIGEYRKRYNELLSIMMYRNLDEDEQSEMHQLEHPPWAEPGEVWSY
jgi:hypothetical protein